MSVESAQLLAATLSWIDAILAVVLLGLLLPGALALTALTGVLGMQRGDWRLLPGAAGVAALFGACGAVSLCFVRAPAPGQDYWLGLSAVIGGGVLFAGLTGVVQHGLRRRREDRVRHGVLAGPPAVEHEGDLLPHPGGRRHLNAVSAEHYVAEWMRHLGAIDAVVTPVRRDGGVDVRSSTSVAQVKHRADLVPVGAVRELVGVARMEGRQALFFTTGAYSRDALAEASRGGVALFVLRFREGRLVAANRLAGTLLATGLSRSSSPIDAGARAVTAPA